MSESNFFWDPLSENIFQDRDETGVVTAEYTTEPDLYGNLISQGRRSVESQYHFDAAGSTLALSDHNQQVTDTFTYTAFGQVEDRVGSTETPFQYIGQKEYFRDEVMADCHVRARSYRPNMGRWLSRDPLKGADELHGYRYANDPVSSMDPSGLIVISAVRQLLSPDAKCGEKRKGEACVAWKWVLDDKTKRKWPCGAGSGYIIQKVAFYCDIQACSSGMCPDKPPEKPLVTYLEARRITRAFRDATDVASGYCFHPSCGAQRHEGEVKFFCQSQTGDLTKTWKRGRQSFGKKPCIVDGGPLTMEITDTTNEPDWWKKPATTDTPATRHFELVWDCCGCSSPQCESAASPAGKTKTTKEPGAGSEGACGLR